MRWHLVRSVLCKCHPRGSPVLTPHSLPMPPSCRTLAPAHVRLSPRTSLGTLCPRPVCVAAWQDCVVLTAESTGWVCLIPLVRSPVGARSLYHFSNIRKVKSAFKMENIRAGLSHR